ncbi:MAG: carbohydrate kinase family protein [Clostridia bacterium]
MEEKYVCVVGGTNIDICGTPFLYLNKNDSAPGRAYVSAGGVARNISESLSRLGVKVKFLTVIGKDSYAETIKYNCEELNIDLSEALQVESNTSMYLYLTDEKGEMQYAVSDMEILKHLSCEYLIEKIDVLNNAAACVIDTNLSKETLNFLMDNVKSPLFLDPVSTQKAEKLVEIMHNIHTFKPNIIEAEIVSKIKIINEDTLKKAAIVLMEKGVKDIFISLGAFGIYYFNKNVSGFAPSVAKEIVNTTGAGDTTTATLVWAFINGLNIRQAAVAGMKAAAICLSDTKTVSDKLTDKILLD